MPATEIVKSNPKYLVVDDEIVGQTEKEDFEDDTSLPVESGIFVQTYEEALEVLKSNLNIILCCIDIKIPRNKRDIYEKDDGNFETWEDHVNKKVIDLKNEYGTRLIPQIKTDTIIFSAYAELDSLRREAEQYPHVIDYYKKPFVSNNFQKIKSYVGLFKQKISVAPLPKSFDYSLLDDETSSFVRSRATEIKKLMKRTAQDLFNIGNYLIEVKTQLGHGNFMNWLEAEFNWSIRTAARFMSVAQKFELDSLSNLELLPTALYIMAAPSTPEEAIAEMFERAKQGETITEKRAKEIKNKYKALKEQAESKVQLKKVEQVEPEPTENRERRASVDSGSRPSSGLPEKRKIKHEILGVVPSQKAVKNSWWQLGEHHRLFCGEPKNQEFLKRLPKNIGLKINFLPKDDPSLIPMIESTSTLTFHSEHKNLDLDSLVRDSIETSTKVKDIVVFNYIYDVGLLELVEGLDCYFWVAEPDLEKCEQILTMWREKGAVTRIKN